MMVFNKKKKKRLYPSVKHMINKASESGSKLGDAQKRALPEVAHRGLSMIREERVGTEKKTIEKKEKEK